MLSVYGSWTRGNGLGGSGLEGSNLMSDASHGAVPRTCGAEHTKRGRVASFSTLDYHAPAKRRKCADAGVDARPTLCATSVPAVATTGGAMTVAAAVTEAGTASSLRLSSPRHARGMHPNCFILIQAERAPCAPCAPKHERAVEVNSLSISSLTSRVCLTREQARVRRRMVALSILESEQCLPAPQRQRAALLMRRAAELRQRCAHASARAQTADSVVRRRNAEASVETLGHLVASAENDVARAAFAVFVKQPGVKEKLVRARTRTRM